MSGREEREAEKPLKQVIVNPSNFSPQRPEDYIHPAIHILEEAKIKLQTKENGGRVQTSGQYVYLQCYLGTH